MICPAPLPEDPADARLTGLLVPAPHVVPENKAKKKATGTRKSSRFQVSSDDDSEADSSHKGEEEKKKASPPAGGGKKRKASPMGEAEGSKKGKTLSPAALPTLVMTTRTGLQGTSLRRDRKYPDSRITSKFSFSATLCLSNAAYNPVVRLRMISPLRRAGP